ncbi:hypothetical protein ABB37_05035 [Leptomonas pyrrhocoris]|uniref:Uncharacterized protein n=1 Tax=Leptomonas pyrrhocoris TaxID=157538 RepID=A0A0M9G123_LEPPY|nr:hypothetical protein ABB37_05035 [Leptomonas pyrrhocoris]KPA80006.1 hypothetical protein ABB37_05035 [Leptomonas pyrrhocoris]|eukprot:XP_015658445.1 hypothetical protein ABB37_05035 [Leptomonas pyrrhocoris]
MLISVYTLRERNKHFFFAFFLSFFFLSVWHVSACSSQILLSFFPFPAEEQKGSVRHDTRTSLLFFFLPLASV